VQTAINTNGLDMKIASKLDDYENLHNAIAGWHERYQEDDRRILAPVINELQKLRAMVDSHLTALSGQADAVHTQLVQMGRQYGQAVVGHGWQLVIRHYPATVDQAAIVELAERIVMLEKYVQPGMTVVHVEPVAGVA
jgi:hypothetical protein